MQLSDWFSLSWMVGKCVLVFEPVQNLYGHHPDYIWLDLSHYIALSLLYLSCLHLTSVVPVQWQRRPLTATHLPTNLSTHTPIHSSIFSSFLPSVDWVIDWLIYWFYWLFDWLLDWSIGWRWCGGGGGGADVVEASIMLVQWFRLTIRCLYAIMGMTIAFYGMSICKLRSSGLFLK